MAQNDTSRPEYWDAPEVVPSQSPEHISHHPAHGGSPDFGGEKVYVNHNINQDPRSYPQPLGGTAAINRDPASAPQVVGDGGEVGDLDEKPEYNKDPRSFAQPLGLNGVGGSEGSDTAGSPFSPTGGSNGVPSKRPWWRRKKLIAIVAAVALVAIALIIGLSVGLTQGGGDDEGDEGNEGHGDAGGRQGSPR